MSQEARVEILNGGARALLLINGGGIVALLGLLSRFYPFAEDANKGYVSVVLFGIACLTLGLLFAAMNYYFRYWASMYWERKKAQEHRRMFWFEKASVIASFAFFFVGAFGLVLGTYSVLHNCLFIYSGA
jgi:formate hydrogenlyase subunit 3/multisubunit Na+/H+ antiporter MnhD subunit